MNKSIKILFLFILLSVPAGIGRVQAAVGSSLNEKVVKWEPFIGKNGELIIFLPEGVETATDGGYSVGKNGGHVDKKLVLGRYINGVVLLVEYYEGDAKRIQDFYRKNEKLPAGPDEKVNGFDRTQFAGVVDDYYRKVQYYRIKDRLYVLKGIAKSENEPLIENFFRSVKLISDDAAVSPNVPKDVKLVTLPNIIERESVKNAADSPIEEDEADRKVIMLYTPRPKFDFNVMRANRSGKVKLKVLYSSTGKVGDVEVLESPSKALAEAAVQAMKQAKFLPAEKDGKPVSVYQVQQYGFELESRIFIL